MSRDHPIDVDRLMSTAHFHTPLAASAPVGHVATAGNSTSPTSLSLTSRSVTPPPGFTMSDSISPPKIKHAKKTQHQSMDDASPKKQAYAGMALLPTLGSMEYVGRNFVRVTMEDKDGDRRNMEECERIVQQGGRQAIQMVDLVGGIQGTMLVEAERKVEERRMQEEERRVKMAVGGGRVQDLQADIMMTKMTSIFEDHPLEEYQGAYCLALDFLRRSASDYDKELLAIRDRIHIARQLFKDIAHPECDHTAERLFVRAFYVAGYVPSHAVRLPKEGDVVVANAIIDLIKSEISEWKKAEEELQKEENLKAAAELPADVAMARASASSRTETTDGPTPPLTRRSSGTDSESLKSPAAPSKRTHSIEGEGEEDQRRKRRRES